LGSKTPPVVTGNLPEVAATAAPVCTRVCTSGSENPNAGTPETPDLDALAAMLAGLSEADRQRVLAAVNRKR